MLRQYMLGRQQCEGPAVGIASPQPGACWGRGDCGSSPASAPWSSQHGSSSAWVPLAVNMAQNVIAHPPFARPPLSNPGALRLRRNGRHGPGHPHHRKTLSRSCRQTVTTWSGRGSCSRARRDARPMATATSKRAAASAHSLIRRTQPLASLHLHVQRTACPVTASECVGNLRSSFQMVPLTTQLPLGVRRA
jgi:hypothetical protein